MADLTGGAAAHAWVRGKLEQANALVESDAPRLVWLDPRYTQSYGRTKVEAEHLALCWQVKFLAHDMPAKQVGWVLVDAQTGQVMQTMRAPLSVGGGASEAKEEDWGTPKRIEIDGKIWRVAAAKPANLPNGRSAPATFATAEFAKGLRTLAYDPVRRLLWEPGGTAWSLRLASR